MPDANPKRIFLVSLIMVGIIVLPTMFSSITYDLTIGGLGGIKYPTPPPPVYTGQSTLSLHTSGKDIVYPNDTQMVLRGVWQGMFADSCTGWWGTAQTDRQWNEAALNITLDFFRSKGVNVFSTFLWGDWWMEDKNATLMGGNNVTDVHYRYALKRTADICAEKGMYFQIRLYGCSRAEGHVEGLPFQPYYSWTVQDFVNFWGSVSYVFRNNNNLVYVLYDEPVGDMATYFSACDQAIAAIRGNETEIAHLVGVTWAYCGSLDWALTYVAGGHTTSPNFFFSEHIYRYHGTFAYDSNAPSDIAYIRTWMTNTQLGQGYTGTLTNYTQYELNIPVFVTAIGCSNGGTDDSEYVAFWNILQVLNEIGVGYSQFSWTHTSWQWTPFVDPSNTPNNLTYNRVGQALFDAIAGIHPPTLFTLDIVSNTANPIIYAVNGTASHTPHNHTLFGGGWAYEVTMPPTSLSYVHSVLVGSTAGEGGSGSGFPNYVYSCSPVEISSPTSVSSVYVYTAVPCNVKAAIYKLEWNNFTSPNRFYATTLVTTNNTATPCSVGWNLIPFSTVALTSGSPYSLSVHADASGAIVSSEARVLHGMTWAWNQTSDNFDPDVSSISDTIGNDVAVYIPYAPLTTTTSKFSHWEDGSTNPVRIINFTTNIAIIATYEEIP